MTHSVVSEQKKMESKLTVEKLDEIGSRLQYSSRKPIKRLTERARCEVRSVSECEILTDVSEISV
jgi:hypothetical protein